MESQAEEANPSQEEGAAVADRPAEAEWRPLQLRFDVPPHRLYHFVRQFRRSGGCSSGGNFLKGVKWSPDGSCFLTSSDDNSLRVFSLPRQQDSVGPPAAADDADSYAAEIVVNAGESVYDFAWYPCMSSLDPTTCVFACTTRDHPIHLWDAMTGDLRCTYRAYDAMDEIVAALSISFNSTGTKIFAGYNKSIKIFDLHRPGRDFEEHCLLKDDEGLSGLVSSMAFSPSHSGMLAAGTYNQTVGIYAEANMEPLYVLHGQQGGVTQVLFSKDGNYLYTGGRKDPYILCWDIRNVKILYKLYRSSENTNQRISFDIEPSGHHLATGGQDGLVHVYDLQNGQWVTGFQAAADTVNGLSFHPYLQLAATSSGHRRFDMQDDDSEDDFDDWPILRDDENCCSIWMFACSDEKAVAGAA